jgi:manganese/zinc/iron transport system ATP- binding protein
MSRATQPTIASDRGLTVETANASQDAALSVRGLTVAYGEKPAIFSVDATFEADGMSAIVGPNGAGKSTLLKAALGVIPRLSGDVHVFGEPVADARARIAYVPQSASVDWDFPTTVMDVVQMGLYRKVGLLGRLAGQPRDWARDCLDRVGMADFAGRQIGQLSGGQQQRVFLARALAQDADLYLLDEPFAGVDAATERAVIDVLKALKSENKAVVAVHHDLATVRDYFDHVFLINVRRIAEGPVATTFTSDNLQAAYSGRLAATHLDELSVVVGAR